MPLINSTPFQTPSFGTLIASDSPTFWFRLGETSGTAAVDAVAANNGTYINTPTLNQTRLVSKTSDPSVSFDDSSSERVDLSTAVRIGNLSNHSIEAWVKPASVPANGERFGIYSENSTNGAIYIVSIQTTGGTDTRIWSFIWNGSSGFSITGTTPISAGNTYHVVVTKDATNGYEQFVNNVSQGTNTSLELATQAVNNRRIGAYDIPALTPAKYFDGVIDEVIGYNYTLTTDQIAEHYSYTI